jgi:transposase
VGKQAGAECRRLFALWHAFRREEISRSDLQCQSAPLRARGAAAEDRRARALCRDLRRLWDALWTFLYEEGVEPTNNAAERALRQSVLQRKTSFGSNSGRGLRATERLLTVSETCRQQQRPLLDYLTAAITALRLGQPAPALLWG